MRMVGIGIYLKRLTRGALTAQMRQPASRARQVRLWCNLAWAELAGSDRNGIGGTSVMFIQHAVLKPDWKRRNSGSPQQISNQFLTAPLSESSSPILPSNTLKLKSLPSDLILELVDVTDIGTSLYSLLSRIKEMLDKNRPVAEMVRELSASGMLRATLTDGYAQIKALVYVNINGLTRFTPKGSKVLASLNSPLKVFISDSFYSRMRVSSMELYS